MKIDVIKLDGKKAGSVELVDDVFGLEPRADILHRVVRWQRNGAQAGTHKVKTRREVSYSTKKIYRQKGTGGARHGSRRAPIFVNDTFAKAVQNIEGLDVLPSMGANVYDILKRDTLVITKAGVEALEARLR